MLYGFLNPDAALTPTMLTTVAIYMSKMRVLTRAELMPLNL